MSKPNQKNKEYPLQIIANINELTPLTNFNDFTSPSKNRYGIYLINDLYHFADRNNGEVLYSSLTLQQALRRGTNVLLSRELLKLDERVKAGIIVVYNLRKDNHNLYRMGTVSGAQLANIKEKSPWSRTIINYYKPVYTIRDNVTKKNIPAGSIRTCFIIKNKDSAADFIYLNKAIIDLEKKEDSIRKKIEKIVNIYDETIKVSIQID